MKPLAALLTLDVLQGLASRSNFRFGQEVLKHGEVIVQSTNPFHAVLQVRRGNGEVNTVDFLSTPKGLRWKCSCTAKKDFFCKHAAGAGLWILEQESESKL